MNFKVSGKETAHRFNRVVLLLFLSMALFIPGANTWAQDAPQKIVILPFNMNTPGDLHYLQDGIRDMLASRLASQGKVQVVDQAATLQAARSVQGEMSQNAALRIARSLKADHVIFGSVTAFGQAVSIDSKMVSVASDREPISFVVQTQNMDEVIPQINRFAQQINRQVFGMATDPTQPTAQRDSDSHTRHPDQLFAGMRTRDDRLSYLNPNFLEITSPQALHQPGIWRSQTFQGGILGMDVGDITGDGETEVVTITTRQVNVYKKQADGLRNIATYSGTLVDQFIWVVVMDVNRDGRSEIFITNLRRFNEARPADHESSYGTRGYTEQLASMGLSFGGGQLEPLFTNAGYFLNAVDIPGRGRVLIGQEKGLETEGPFRGPVMEMQLSGRALSPASPLHLPDRCNVFNFAMGDINNNGSNEIVFIDYRNNLNIADTSGQLIWKGDQLFAATTNMFEGAVRNRRYNDVDMFAIPSPIIIKDLSGDGIAEIIVNRSPGNLVKFLPAGMKNYDKSEIVSLSWDQLGIVENWRTREVAGMVTSIRFADLENDGSLKLVAGLVLARDFLKLGEARSTIFSYDLNLSESAAHTAQRMDR